MSHPYVPLGTPVTITVDGFWDGYHNGNEPYLSYVGHDGQTKKIHIPHGALVQTKPEEVEAVEFTVDKTPKPPVDPIRMDLDLNTGEWHHVDGEKCPEGCKYHERTPAVVEPKLRTKKDRDGDLWFKVGPDRWIAGADRRHAEALAAGHSWQGGTLSSVEDLYGPLTDVTDTGEPLPRTAAELGAMSVRASLRDAGLGIPERFECSRCDDSDDAFCAEHTYWSTKNAEFQRFWREFNDTGKVPGWAQDTPRKPEPGDQVRVKTPNGNSFEGTYVTEYRAGKDQVSVVEDDCILTVTGHPKDLVWEVIEPARPKVPDEPEGVERVLTHEDRIALLTGGGWIVVGDPRQDPGDRKPETYDWHALWHYHGPLHERGPVIGGE